MTVKERGTGMKHNRIRERSPIWWAGKTLKWTGRIVLIAAVEWSVMAGMLALYAARCGLPMPWEGLL